MADADAWTAFGRAPASGDAPTTTAPSPASDAPQTVPDSPWAAFGRAPEAVQPATPAAEPDTTIGHKIGLGVRNVVQGIAGPLYDLAGAPLRAVGLPVQSLSENLTALGLPQPQTSGEQLASSIIEPMAGTLTGQGVGRAMAGAASPVVQAVGGALASQPATQAVAAGVGGAVTQETGSPTAGTLAAMAVPFAGSVNRLISPNLMQLTPERAAMQATAAREGIPTTIAQQTGGKVARNLETTLAQLPGSSGAMAEQSVEQGTAFNAAVLRRAGINATQATPDVLQAGRAQLGTVFDDLSARNTLTPDPQMMTELADLRAKIGRDVPESIRGPLLNRIEDVDSAIAGGTMPGQAYREMYTSLGQKIKGTSDGDTRSYLGQLRDTLRGAMDRSISPEDQQAWQDVRQKYAVLQTIAKAMDRPSEGTVSGNISPAALAQASRNQASKSFAFGQGSLDDLSRLGQGMLKPGVPDSGTSQRSMMTSLLQGKTALPALALAGATHNPLYLAAPAAEVGIPRAAAAIYNSDWLKKYLTNQLAVGIGVQRPGVTAGVVGLESLANRLADPTRRAQ